MIHLELLNINNDTHMMVFEKMINVSMNKYDTSSVAKLVNDLYHTVSNLYLTMNKPTQLSFYILDTPEYPIANKYDISSLRKSICNGVKMFVIDRDVVPTIESTVLLIRKIRDNGEIKVLFTPMLDSTLLEAVGENPYSKNMMVVAMEADIIHTASRPRFTTNGRCVTAPNGIPTRVKPNILRDQLHYYNKEDDNMHTFKCNDEVTNIHYNSDLSGNATISQGDKSIELSTLSLVQFVKNYTDKHDTGVGVYNDDRVDKLCEIAVICSQLESSGKIVPNFNDLHEAGNVFREIYNEWSTMPGVFESNDEVGYISIYAERALLERYGVPVSGDATISQGNKSIELPADDFINRLMRSVCNCDEFIVDKFLDTFQLELNKIDDIMDRLTLYLNVLLIVTPKYGTQLSLSIKFILHDKCAITQIFDEIGVNGISFGVSPDDVDKLVDNINLALSMYNWDLVDIPVGHHRSVRSYGTNYIPVDVISITNGRKAVVTKEINKSDNGLAFGSFNIDKPSIDRLGEALMRNTQYVKALAGLGDGSINRFSDSGIFVKNMCMKDDTILDKFLETFRLELTKINDVVDKLVLYLNILTIITPLYSTQVALSLKSDGNMVEHLKSMFMEIDKYGVSFQVDRKDLVNLVSSIHLAIMLYRWDLVTDAPTNQRTNGEMLMFEGYIPINMIRIVHGEAVEMRVGAKITGKRYNYNRTPIERYSGKGVIQKLIP
jgi:hypothetical protein